MKTEHSGHADEEDDHHRRHHRRRRRRRRRLPGLVCVLKLKTLRIK